MKLTKSIGEKISSHSEKIKEDHYDIFARNKHKDQLFTNYDFEQFVKIFPYEAKKFEDFEFVNLKGF